MADNFSRDQFRWLDQVLEDAGLTHLCFSVGYTIAHRYLNRKSRLAWPTIATIARAVHSSPRRTQEAVSLLIARGHLTHRRGGKGKPSVYSLAFIDVPKMADQQRSRCDESGASSEGLTCHNPQLDRTKTVSLISQNRPTNPLNEPSEEPTQRPAPLQGASAVYGSGYLEQAFEGREDILGAIDQLDSESYRQAAELLAKEGHTAAVRVIRARAEGFQ